MDFNDPSRDGCCTNRFCRNSLRALKRRRLYEPDEVQDEHGNFECACGRSIVDMPPEESSGDDGEFSDDNEAENAAAASVSNAPTQQIQDGQGNSSGIRGGNAGGAGSGEVTMAIFGSIPSLSAPLQSPRTPGSVISAAGSTGNTRVEEFCWQESRPTLTKRAGYLLNNSRMSDVRFLVGETKTEIHAHKTLLALGSPVFETQFYSSNWLASGAGASDVIELPDMDPDIFLLFLKYLYTDELEPSLDDAQLLGLLRPAKKYIVPHLVDKCSDILMTELKPENIFSILNYSQFYQLKKLEGACERYVDRHSEAIVASEEFAALEKPILTEFLKRDSLNIKEETLFQAVLRWATAECQRNSIVPNFENLRSVLGDCLKLIRFPTMSKEEFASTFESTNILSPEEACSVFVYMCKSTPVPSVSTLKFPTTKRHFCPQLCVVSRFNGAPVDHCLNYRSGEIYNYRIHFKVDRPIYMKGANIFSIRCGGGPQICYSGNRRDFSGAIYLYEKGAAVYLGRKQFNRYGSLEADTTTSPVSEDSSLAMQTPDRRQSQYYPVYFQDEIPIPSGKTFTLCVVVSVNSHSYPSQPLQTYVGTNERNRATVMYAEDLPINFTFSSSSGDGSVGKFTSAQIPEIIFCL